MSDTNFKLGNNLIADQATFRVGDVVTYTTLDEEYYSRGYGINYETKASTIVSIYYKMANGDMMEEKKLMLVLNAESKSEPPKTQ
jgi:hypothetical protein